MHVDRVPVLMLIALTTFACTPRSGFDQLPQVRPSPHTEQLPAPKFTRDQIVGNEGSLQIWLTLLSTQRTANVQVPDTVGPLLRAQLAEADTWKARMRDLASFNTYPTEEPMRIEVVGGWARPHLRDSRFWTASKYLGEIEVNNVKIAASTSLSLTDADRANGILWNGMVTVSFIRRYRSILLNEAYGPPDVTRTWMMDLDPSRDPPLPNWSAWQSESVMFKLRKRGDAWLHDKLEGSVAETDFFWVMDLPTSALYTKNCDRPTSREKPCLLVNGFAIPQ